MANKNNKVRSFIVNSFLEINQDDPEILAIFHDKLYGLGNIIKQRDSKLFDEIIRLYTDSNSNEKIKVKLNRTGRIM